MMADLLDWLETFTASPWFYLAIFSVAYLDSIFPLVPGETTVILGGIAAGQGDLSLILVILIGAAGAFGGDSTSYWLGRTVSEPLQRRFFSSEKAQHRLKSAEHQLDKRGGLLLLTARFIPGGRTAVTLTSGITLRPYRWFARWAIVAGLVWSTYAAGLGFVAGEQFEENKLAAFLVAISAALGVTAVVETIRWLRGRKKERSLD